MDQAISQPIPPIPPKKDYSLVVILSILLIIAAAIATLLLYQNQKLIKELKQYQTAAVYPIPSPTPTSDPTANWQTYTNTKYGYAVKYPSDWSGSCPSQPCDSAAMFSVTKQPIGLDIIVKQKAQVVTPKDAFSKAVTTQIFSQQEMIIDSIPAYAGLVKEGPAEIGPFLKQHIFVVKNVYIYQITFSEKLEKGDEMSLRQQQLFDQILSTFKFAD